MNKTFNMHQKLMDRQLSFPLLRGFMF